MSEEVIEKKKRFIPELRFQEFQEKWREVRLGKICSNFKSGTNITSKNIFEEGPYPVYGGNGLRGYTNTFSHEGLFLLIGRQGALCGNINKVHGKNFISEHAIAVQADKENDTEWLAQKLDYFDLNRLSESSAQPGLAVSKLERLKLKIPSLPEQQKIASFLSAVDKKIQQLTRKKTLLETYKKGVMQKLFSQEIRFKDEDGKDFPEWEEKSLKTLLINYRLGGNYTNTDNVTAYPLIKMGNLGRGKINLSKVEYIPVEEKLDEKDKLKYGDLLFNTRNTLELVGKVSIWQNELPIAYYNSNLMYLKFENNFFMNYRMNSYEGIKALKRFATGTTSVAAIYTKDLLKVKLRIPSLREQQKIADFLSAIDKKTEAVSQQIEKTKTFKKGLLQQMFV
ncbi:restriction endonuclease subunit S [Salinimicrobium sediminilitoris]|uniref:restriction endonuclease subunit S n=1 Tax=Salinimicrobium sediminilitoris TaxID=2876715 RepID=UPI001E3D8325|nr:restriction endonuclease subunit S [Salinimicrobium sediminilitoris]MCC8360652.1 restriction endonuclease subunit S [Salinimicrobium sediminilitoris]